VTFEVRPNRLTKLGYGREAMRRSSGIHVSPSRLARVDVRKDSLMPHRRADSLCALDWHSSSNILLWKKRKILLSAQQ